MPLLGWGHFWLYFCTHHHFYLFSRPLCSSKVLRHVSIKRQGWERGGNVNMFRYLGVCRGPYGRVCLYAHDNVCSVWACIPLFLVAFGKQRKFAFCRRVILLPNVDSRLLKDEKLATKVDDSICVLHSSVFVSITSTSRMLNQHSSSPLLIWKKSKVLAAIHCKT